MRVPSLLAALLMAAVPIALAHEPPGPVVTCQDPLAAQSKYHDYLPPATGDYVRAGDGNVEDCGPGNVVLQPRYEGTALCEDLGDAPAVYEAVCEPFDTGVPSVLLDFDGELDHAVGGALLAVVSGDGVSGGSLRCYGVPGHHTARVYAAETGGTVGPPFLISSDYARSDNPDPLAQACGDNILEPCFPAPPPPSSSPFPMNVLLDTINSLLFELFGPAGSGCNPLDCADGANGAVPGPSHRHTGCAPGADGSYLIYVSDATHPGIQIPFAGHVWTT